MTYRHPGWDKSAGHDEVRFGSSGQPRSLLGRWGGRLVVTAAVIAAVSVVVTRAAGEHNQPKPPAAGAGQVVVTYAGHRLLGSTGKWQLVARGPRYLVVIRLATGKITRTAVPPIFSNNPEVALLAGPHEVVVRSFDLVPGYVVPAGAPARLLTGTLEVNSPGPLLPGPKAGEDWVVVSSPTSQSIVLVGTDGRLTRTTIQLPGGALPFTAVSDGRGYVLLLDQASGENLYDAGPTWHRQLQAQVLAVGPTSWLGVVCHNRCVNVVIDPTTGSQRVLPGPGLRQGLNWPTVGVTAPNGSMAAVPSSGEGGNVRLRLVNLYSGASRPVDMAMVHAPCYQVMVWSPDSRWLFVAAADGRLLAVSSRTGKVTGLGISLPPVSQVAISAAPGRAAP